METARSCHAPGHRRCIVRESEASVRAEQDDSAMSAKPVVEIADGFACGKFGRSAGGNAVGSPLAKDQLHDGFTPAGERHCGGEIVSVAATTDKRRVAHTAGRFVEGASGGCGSGEIAARVEGDGTNCVMAFRGAPWAVGVLYGIRGLGIGCLRRFVVEVTREGGIGEAGSLTRLCLGEPLAFAFEHELRVINELHTMRLRETLCAIADEVHMRTLFEDEACRMDGVAQPFYARDTSRLHPATVHQKRVKLHAAVGGEKAATASVEGGIVFEYRNGGLDGVDGSAAAGENLVA
jgi:hypothetical protein